MRSRKSSARDTFRSSLHSTHTSTSLHGDRATRLDGGILFNIIRSRTSSPRDTFRSLLHSTRTPTTLPNSTGASTNRTYSFNIVRSRTSSARDTFRSLFHSTRTSTSQHGGHDKKLYGDGLPFLILSDHERAVRGSQLGPSCPHPVHIPVRTEAPLPNCTVAAFPF